MSLFLDGVKLDFVLKNFVDYYFQVNCEKTMSDAVFECNYEYLILVELYCTLL